MPLKLTELMEKRKELTIEFEGDEFNFSYNPGLFTKSFRAELKANEEQEGSLFEAIEKTVLKWDLQDDEGGMHPITVANMEKLPTKLLFQIWIAILEDTADFLPKQKSRVSVAA